MKTFTLRIDPSERKWWVVDLKDVRLGRAAVQIADILRGKNKPIFSPHIDNGDNVIAINAGSLSFTGKKLTQKKYYRYSGYPGGLSELSLTDMMIRSPERVFTLAVKRMLPKNRLASKQLRKLHVYAGSEHCHSAQKPEKLELKKYTR
ncbi:MAG: 50S ribosomal protein L13 [Candidatus Zixiibacteriota bacterium]|nr:MAG: 50S ribosomal protein L13 [candidate division Zixibacteria bacterium]